MRGGTVDPILDEHKLIDVLPIAHHVLGQVCPQASLRFFDESARADVATPSALPTSFRRSASAL